LDEAVGDGFLVPPFGVSVGTTFLRQGIAYDDLSDQEKDQWDALDWGEDGPPASVDSEELNRFLFNEDTVDKVLATLMTEGRKVAGGDRLGKTVIFAKNQAHAAFLERRFNVAYPEYGGEFAQVITHRATYAQNLIDNFSQADKAPHIAISVDMLDTGIDVPEIVNLVFFKMVRSKTKFWQMIGRGTRLRPTCSRRAATRRTSSSSTSAATSSTSARTCPGPRGRSRSRSPNGSSRPAWAW